MEKKVFSGAGCLARMQEFNRTRFYTTVGLTEEDIKIKQEESKADYNKRIKESIYKHLGIEQSRGFNEGVAPLIKKERKPVKLFDISSRGKYHKNRESSNGNR